MLVNSDGSIELRVDCLYFLPLQLGPHVFPIVTGDPRADGPGVTDRTRQIIEVSQPQRAAKYFVCSDRPRGNVPSGVYELREPASSH
jgi:hypothetical protein